MCFGGGNTPQAAAAPAPAPPPPAEVAEEQDVAAARVAENQELFGGPEPTLRVDRSLNTGPAGTGIRM
jgi:hypothetical protein